MCIIIHGFAGNPREIEPLAHALKKLGYTIRIPLLPGHRMNDVRMKKATALEWIQKIEKIVLHSLTLYKKIHVIGFSMGAMIASIMASRYSITSLVLLSPAVIVLSSFLLKKKLKKMFHQSRGERSSNSNRTVNLPPFIQTARFSNMVQFQKVVSQAKEIFQHISIPVCIIHGAKDETADPKSSDLIFRLASSKEKELHFLPQSGHHICLDCEADHVNQLVTDFLNKYR